MPTKVNVWQCYYCSRFRSSREGEVREHEVHCYKRADRLPWRGEVTQVRTILGGKTPPAWWPKPLCEGDDGAGRIWTGKGWPRVLGYKKVSVSGYRVPTEIWPIFDGVSLINMKPALRLAALGIDPAAEKWEPL